MAWGEYPPEYNARVHGPYDPSRWYGKPDTQFRQVKLGELGAWFARRNKNPQAIVSAISRGWWTYTQKWMHPLRPGLAPYMQIVVGCMLYFYVANYGKYRKHRFYKYHW